MTQAINIVLIHRSIAVCVCRDSLRQGIKHIVGPCTAVDDFFRNGNAIVLPKRAVDKRTRGIGERLEIERTYRKVILAVDLQIGTQPAAPIRARQVDVRHVRDRQEAVLLHQWESKAIHHLHCAV